MEDGLIKVYDATTKKIGKLDTLAKFGIYLDAIQEADERFTGRAIKNITDAIKVRAMDFELPDEWMEKPDLFLTKDPLGRQVWKYPVFLDGFRSFRIERNGLKCLEAEDLKVHIWRRGDRSLPLFLLEHRCG